METKTMTKLQYFRQQYDDGIITKPQLQTYIDQIMMAEMSGRWLVVGAGFATQ